MFEDTLKSYTILSGRSVSQEIQVIHQLCDTATPYTLEGRSVLGRVSRVIDGDSMHISMSIDGHVSTFPCRIANLDCPEIRTRNLKEKELGLLAKKHVEELIRNDVICIKIGEFDKFGRLLTTIYTPDGTNIAESLIEHGLGREYNGGKRSEW